MEDPERFVPAQIRARPQQGRDLSELLQGQQPDPQQLLQPDHQVGCNTMTVFAHSEDILKALRTFVKENHTNCSQTDSYSPKKSYKLNKVNSFGLQTEYILSVGLSG